LREFAKSLAADMMSVLSNIYFTKIISSAAL